MADAETVKSDLESRDAFDRGSYATFRYATAAAAGDGYFQRLQRRKDDIVAQYATGARVLDLCCGEGAHVAALAQARYRVGGDISQRLLRGAKTGPGLAFVNCNARTLPFASGSFDLVYALSALYLIPKIGDVVSEIARVLAPCGRAVLDLGNRNSLNALVCRTMPELLPLQVFDVRGTRRMLREAGFTIESHFAFQVLPLWGNNPRWLRPLLFPIWTRLMALRLGGHMLDEWLASLPILRQCAFRHIFVCRKK